MTSRERIDRCFRHLETDRPGLVIRGVDTAYPSDRSFDSLRKIVMGQCEIKKSFRLASFKDTASITKEIENMSSEFGRQIQTLHTPDGDLCQKYIFSHKGNPGYIEKHFIETREDAEIYLSTEPAKLSIDFEQFLRVDRELGDRGIVCVDLENNPAGSVAELVGSERFALWSIDERELLHELMRHEMKSMLSYVTAAVAAGIGPYFAMYGEEYLTPPLHGANDFIDFNVRYDKPIADFIHNAGGLLHIHCHGPIKNVLSCFIDIGADVLHPIEAPPMGDVPIKLAKDILRDKVTVEGNIQIGDLFTKTPDEIAFMAEEVISQAFDDSKGLIVCPTASPYAPVLTEQALSNYLALIKTVLR